ncbi:MAG TPA: DNA polymerase I [Solirubrobacteraceae bacterium]|nr:DNA polymerase I [Solirubrobacteraceae bacterium]
MPTLFLIDGNSLVYRAFFALPEAIATSAGEPTNAIFGFASMLVKLITEHGVEPTVVAWDAGSSGRSEIYSEYKAGRQSRPDLLREQWPAFDPLVAAFGYRNARLDGYEADDVIATLAERARSQGIPVTIVTGDRDAFQLVDEAGLVSVMATARGITETKLYDRAAVLERYGIAPELIPDFYGLKGDTSDNIPGIPGIGEKTAAELLQRFGSLESVLDRVAEVSGEKRRANLITYRDDALISKQLATMQRDLPVELDVAEIHAGQPDMTALRDVFRRYELRDPLRRLEEAIGAADTAGIVVEPVLVKARKVTVAQLAALGEGELAIAVRPPEVPEGALFGADAAWSFGVATADEVLAGEVAEPSELVSALEAHPIAAHDAKSLDAVPQRLAHDTMLAAYLLDPARRGYPLAELCEDRGIAVPPSSAGDAQAVRTLTDFQRPELTERDLDGLLREVELPLVGVLRDMEVAGVRLDVPRLNEVGGRVAEEIRTLEQSIFTAAGDEFLIGSPQQLGAILFERLGLSRKRRGKTGFSTDARVLAAIRSEHEIVPLIERWRELSTLIKTYLEPLPAQVDHESRLHTTFLQTVASTGRLSSTNPNLQNIPIRTPLGREIRACFVAAPGDVLVCADYSQIELRVLAQLADEPVLKEIFRRGEDVHTATACQVFQVEADEIDAGMRSKAKMINYGIAYGLTDFGLADRLQIPREEAAAFIATYFERFPAVREFIERTIAQAIEQGYVTTLLGRRRPIPELRARNRQQHALGERLAVNTVIQGTAADIIKVAMVRAHKALTGLRSRLILQIHDELMIEGPVGESDEVRGLITTEMVGAWELDPPLGVDVGVGENWLAAK